MYNVLDYLENSTKKYPRKIAVICEDKKITYSKLTSYSKKVGSFLQRRFVYDLNPIQENKWIRLRTN